MKLVCNLNNMNELSKLAPYADFILLKRELCTLDNLRKIKAQNLVPILDYSLMVTPFEIEKLTKEIMTFKDEDCLFYITDLGLAHILKEANLITRTIYDPITMLTNSLDVNEYASYGFKALGLSNEITIEDTKNIVLNSVCPLFIQVFGHRLMFHSRRKLTSLYAEKLNVTFEQKNMVIKEATREDYFPIEETKNGTYIYRSYAINMLEKLKELDIDFIFLNSYRIVFSTYLEVVKIYADYLEDKLNLAEALEKFRSLNVHTEDGFMYTDSVYNKEEF